MTTTILSYGPLKTQRFPFRVWNELKSIQNNEDLIQFFQNKEPNLKDFVVERTSPNTAKKLFESGKAKRHDCYFLSETLKSAILRAGGTKIASWGYWYEDPDLHGAECTELVVPINKMYDISVFDMNVKVPLSFEVKIDRKETEKIKNATKLIHKKIKNSCEGSKILTRADYVIERCNDEIQWGLVDVGESNLTMGLSDSLLKTFLQSYGRETGLLESYVSVLLQEFFIRKGYLPKNIGLVPENEQMVKNMPYEFNAMKRELEIQLMKEGLRPHVNLMFKGDLLYGNPLKGKRRYDLLVRCFRSCDGLEIISNKLQQGLYETVMIDDLEFIPKYQKCNLMSLVKQQKSALEPSIKIPKSGVVKLKDTSSTAQEIFDYVRDNSIDDFVVKPGKKTSNIPSMALFYHTANTSHLNQLKRSLRRFKRQGSTELVVEEMLGDGALKGYKAEVRVYCFG